MEYLLFFDPEYFCFDPEYVLSIFLPLSHYFLIQNMFVLIQNMCYPYFFTPISKQIPSITDNGQPQSLGK